MLDRKGWARVAACAALACAGVARAQASPADEQPPRPLYLQETQPTTMPETTAEVNASPTTTPATAPAAPTKPLMLLLDKAGVGKSLEDAGINIYGFIE